MALVVEGSRALPTLQMSCGSFASTLVIHVVMPNAGAFSRRRARRLRTVRLSWVCNTFFITLLRLVISSSVVKCCFNQRVTLCWSLNLSPFVGDQSDQNA